jgi:hypothetical protein
MDAGELDQADGGQFRVDAHVILAERAGTEHGDPEWSNHGGQCAVEPPERKPGLRSPGCAG